MLFRTGTVRGPPVAFKMRPFPSVPRIGAGCRPGGW